MDVKQRVRDFIRSNFYVPESVELSDDSSLLLEGIIDSTGVLELVAFLEEAFGVGVSDAELTPDNLDSLSNIEAFVLRKKAA